MATIARRSRTVCPPGRNEARTRQARAPSLRSRLAGCTWSASNGVSAVIAAWAISASMAWQGRMPGRGVSLMGGEALAQTAEVARGGGGCASAKAGQSLALRAEPAPVSQQPPDRTPPMRSPADLASRKNKISNCVANMYVGEITVIIYEIKRIQAVCRHAICETPK